MAKPRTRKSVETEAGEGQAPEIVVEVEAVAEVPAQPVDEVQEGAPAAEPEAAPQDESPAEPPAVEAEAKPSADPQPVAVPEGKRSGFGAMVAGGLIAALIGSGVTLGLLPKLPPSVLEKIVPPSSGQADIGAAVEAQKAQIDALVQELAALRAAPAPVADISGVQAALDAAAASARALQDSFGALEGRVQALEIRPVAEGGVPADGAGLQAQIDQLRAEWAQASSAQSATQEQIAAAAALAQTQIAEAQEQAEALRASSEAAAHQAVAQAAAARVAAAFEAGNSLATAIAEAEAAGLAVPEGLKAEITAPNALKLGFAEAARSALAIARRETAGQTLGEKVGAFLLAQTGARSVAPREGDGPDAVLSRAQAAVDAGDFATAVGEIGALTPGAQEAMQPWVTLAQARLAAAEAVAALMASVK